MNEGMNDSYKGGGAMFFLVSNIWWPFCPYQPHLEGREGGRDGEELKTEDKQKALYSTIPPDMCTMHTSAWKIFIHQIGHR